MAFDQLSISSVVWAVRSASLRTSSATGKAAPLLASTGSFDGSVQRQQIGLVGDILMTEVMLAILSAR